MLVYVPLELAGLLPCAAQTYGHANPPDGGPQVFIRERLNGYYSVATFALANTLASAPFIFGIAVISSAVVYWCVRVWAMRPLDARCARPHARRMLRAP